MEIKPEKMNMETRESVSLYVCSEVIAVGEMGEVKRGTEFPFGRLPVCVPFTRVRRDRRL